MEVFQLLKEKYKKDTSGNAKIMENQVRSSIEDLLHQHLQFDTDVLRFEVSPIAIDAVIAVIDNPPLTIKYDIVQVAPYLFDARLKTLDLEV